jgi:SAM-dependent methyltransferase
MLLYGELTPWYHLVDPLADHAEEGNEYRQVLLDAGVGPSLLELGSGAGNNAYYLKQSFRCVLSDLSAEMVALSTRINPECEHVVGDMQSMRLQRQFDAVFVHDAICYMRTEAELARAIETAFVHTREGGVALFVPDAWRETFAEGEEVLSASDGEKTLRCLMWTHDPNPDDCEYSVEFAFLLRENGVVRALHDSHTEGLFPLATWLRLLAQAGFTPAVTHERMILCRR